jgi:hypothetical protein
MGPESPMHLFDGWQPDPVPMPTLLVRATEPAPRAHWPVPHDSVDVPGDHFTMMERYARHTAHITDEWLNQLAPGPATT